MSTYSMIDLFAGCGGMSYGFVQTRRFRPVLAVESDPCAADTYGQNFGKDHVINRPIQEVDEFPDADVVIGGPPCQPFSRLNRNGKQSPYRELWREYLRVLEEVRPKAFVMENVPALLDSKEFEQFRRSVQSDALGYSVVSEVLNAADYGTPQLRKRAVVVGLARGNFRWPTPTHGPAGLRGYVTFQEVVSDLPVVPDGRNWHRSRNPWPMSLERYKAVPKEGGDRFQMAEALRASGREDLIPPCWRKKTSGTTDVFGRLWSDQPARTIRTEFFKPEKGRYLHPTEDRPITVREAIRLMGFDDDFVFPEDQSMTRIARQVGNAVPPPLACAIAESLANCLDDPKRVGQQQLALATIGP